MIFDRLYDFLTFRRMITPFVIEFLFLIGSTLAVGVGIGFAIRGLIHDDHSQAAVAAGLAVFGPVVIRLYCEVLIVLFRINETLTDIADVVRDR